MPNDSAPLPPPPTTLPPVSTVLVASGSPGPKFHLPKSKAWIVVSVLILLVAIPASVLLIKNRNTLFSKANNLVTSVSSGVYTNQGPGNYCNASTGTCTIADSSKFILRTVCEGKSTTCGRDGEPVSISTTTSKSTASVVPEQCGRTVQLDVLADNADCRAGKKGGNSACALNPFAWLVWYSGDCIETTVTPVPLPSEEPTPSITPGPLPSEEPTPSITSVPLPSEEPTPSTTPETTPGTTPSPSPTPSATPSTTPTTPSSTPSSTSTPTPTSPRVLTNVPCNGSCSQDSQCEAGFVCYLASGSCRKADNITDPTCGNVGSTTSSGQSAPTPTPVTQLPRSGATDGTWLVGLGGLLLLGLGALFLI